MSDRDPRVEPKPGDRLKRIFTRTVTAVYPKSIWYYSPATRGEAFCSIPAWRKWSKGAEVITHA